MNVATTCFVCGERERFRGLLCDDCARSIAPVDDALCAEQIASRLEPTIGKKNAILVDGFGAGHAVVVDFVSATLGRSRDSDVCVAERTVSLAHAILEHRPKSNAWFIGDVETDNGTWVNGEKIVRRWPLEHGDRVHLGRRVAFLFVPVDDDDIERAAQALRETTHEARSETRRDVRFDDGRPLRVRAVTEGGAIAAWGEASDERAQLSELEYELLVVLERRYSAESDRDVAVRGFVPAAHLLEVLSFKSEAPTHVNLRGLVRKVRGKLAEGNPSLDVIESKKASATDSRARSISVERYHARMIHLAIVALSIAAGDGTEAKVGGVDVVVFSHGFHGCARQSTFLTQALADDGAAGIAPPPAVPAVDRMYAERDYSRTAA